MRNIHHTADPGVVADARELRRRVLALARRRSLRDPIAASCADLDLSPPQIHALLWLGHDGPLTMGELAQRVGVTEKTITGVADRLAQADLVARERDARDRRVVRARLTARGEGVHRHLDQHLHARLAQMLGVLDPPDRRALFRILEKLFRRLEEGAPAGRRA
jgi:DNA-binding MarR family transcriptional regulator